MSAPVLQLAAGRFDPAAPGSLALAVLHPLKLAVFAVVAPAVAGDGGRGLRKLYEHFFPPHFSAANMAWGPFGGGGGARDSVAVQSMDGGLCVFDQAAPGPAAALEGVLLPGPLAYLPRCDSLFTVGSDLTLLGWRLGSVARAGSRAEGGGAPARAPPDWSVNVGDDAAWLLVGRPCAEAGAGGKDGGGGGGGGLDLVVVGDHGLTVVRDPSGGGGGFAAATAAGLATAAVPGGLAGGSGAAAAVAAYGAAVRAHKRLDYLPVAACLGVVGGGGSEPPHLPPRAPSAVGPGDGASGAAHAGAAPPGAALHHVLVATSGGQLRVYAKGGERLLWAARLPFAPAAMSVGTFGGARGLLAALSPRGDLAVCYLGTDPPSGALTGGEQARDVDVAAETKKIAAQLKALKAAAEAAREPPPAAPAAPAAAAGAPPPPPPPRGLSVALAMPTAADAEAPRSGVWEECGTDGECPAATALVALTWGGPSPPPAHGFTVAVAAPSWVSLARGARESAVAPGALARSGGTVTLRLPLCAVRGYAPAGGELRVVVLPEGGGCGGEGEGGGALPAAPAFAAASAPLPLCVGGAPAPPVKSPAPFKLTLDTGAAPGVPLTELFADLLGGAHPPHVLPADAAARVAQSAPTVLSFRCWGGAEATVVASKHAGRYRVQGDAPAAVAMLAAGLVRALAARALPLSLVEPPPAAELLEAVEAHLRARRAAAGAVADLAARAAEVRLAVKRLLTRFRDRAPAPLGGLEALLAVTQRAALHAAAAARAAGAAEAAAANQLEAHLLLFHAALRAKFGERAGGAPALAAALPLEVPVAGLGAPEEGAAPGAAGGGAPGWEECAEAALGALLTAGPPPFAAAAGAAAGAAAPPTTAAIPDSSARLGRLLTVLTSRLEKAAPGV